ncbi:MAG TPA: hypothetical protein VHQ94_19465 [Pyrinomonadaceae bacterium]|jgi:hypothetical protein|nr:hypothetical protein [Pyrinomonadaceae bacterium]
MKAVFVLAAVVFLVVAIANAQFIKSSADVQSMANAIAPVAVPSILDQSQDQEAGPEVKLVLLALRPEGFETNEMQLQPGEHLFIIGNRTGLREVNVRLERQGDGRVAEVIVGGRPRDWKKRLRLTSGVYVLTANDNPHWICRIVVGQ